MVGGAAEVRIVKVNPSTVAIRMLANADGNALLLTSKDAGLFCNRISVLKSMSGVAPADTCDFEAMLDTVNESLSALGSPWFSLTYTALAGNYTSMTASVATDVLGDPAGVFASATRAQLGAATGVVYTAGDKAVVAAATDNGKTVTIYGINSDGLPDSESGLIAIGAYSTTKRWLRVTAATLSAACATVAGLTVSDHLAVNLTLVFGATAVGTAAMTSCPVANRPVYVNADAGCTDPVVLRGYDAAGFVQAEAVYLNGVALVGSKRCWSSLTAVEVGGIAVARTVTTSCVAGIAAVASSAVALTTVAGLGTQVANWTAGDVALVTSTSNADVGAVVTLTGLDAANAIQTETLTMLDVGGITAAVTGTKTWNKIYLATVTAYANAAILTTDAHGNTVQTIDPKRLASGVLGTRSAGLVLLDQPVNATTVSLVANGATVRQALLYGLSPTGATQSELVTLAGAVAVPTVATWSRLDGIYLGDIEAARTVSIQWHYAISGGHTKIQELVDTFNALDGFTAATLDTAPTTDLIAELDIPTVATYGSAQPLNIFGAVKTWYGKLTELIRAINARSALVVATRPSGATGLPADVLSPVYLSGGSEGVTTNADWLAALQKIRADGEVAAILIATTSPTVQAALISQMRDRATTLKREASAFTGLPTGSTKVQIKAAIRLLNSCQIQACAMECRRADSMLVSRRFSPVMQAAVAAGMFCGAPVGRALTRRYLNVDELYWDSSWDPIDDSDEMIDAGLLFAVEKPGVGYYWQRDVTTHLIDNNNAYVEASCKREVDTFCKNGRSWLEEKVGDPNFAGTTTALKTLVFQLLQYALSEGWIVAWRNLTATATGDTSPISVDIAPTQPNNFVPWSIHLYEVTTTA